MKLKNIKNSVIVLNSVLICKGVDNPTIYDCPKTKFTVENIYGYLCEDNISSYRYSGSANDSYHYSIGKYYEIARIDNLIYIAYDERNEVSQKEYEEYIAEHECNNN